LVSGGADGTVQLR